MDKENLYCPNCGNEIKDDGTFCSKCGTNIHTYEPQTVEKSEKRLIPTKNNDIIKGIIVGVCLIIIILSLFVIIGNLGNMGIGTASKTGLIVENVSVSNDMFGQKFTADIIPDKDYDYLGARIVYYDANGAVLKTNAILWNMPDVHKGQHIKMQGDSYSYDYAGKPASAKILFFDSALNQKEDEALFVYTINYK
jgi:hypothetical protein